MAVKIEGLADAITEELQRYNQDVTDGIKAAVKDVAKDCVREIKRKSPVRKGPKGGSYRKGWRAKRMHESPTDVRYNIHNATDYQLTHLLENGHDLPNGGHVKGIPHIAPATEHAEKQLEKKAKVTVKA